MNPTEYDIDVAIIGYGPSGVAAANALGALGVTARVFERDRDIYPRARAVTISDWTMRLFQSVGLAERAKADMDPTLALRWQTYDGQQLLYLPFPKGEMGHATSYAIYQPYLEQTLREGAKRFGDQVEVRYGSEVTDVAQDGSGVTVTSTDLVTGQVSTTRARYALACDGGSSRTREQLGIPLLGDTLDVRWVIIDAKVKRWWPNRHILTFWSDKQRPVVDIALARDNHRWEIPLNPGETDADFDSHDKLWPLLEAMGVSHDDVDIYQHAFYSHHIRSAQRWQEGRVFLVGDAGHLMPPWAGAGMQSGIRDAFNLAWKLAAVVSGKLPETVLGTYEPERRPNVEFYTGVAIQLGQIIKQELPEEELAALTAEPDPDAAPELPPLLWPPAYPSGWFTGDVTPEGAVGKIVPQPRAANVHGEIALLDDFLGHDFVLIGAQIDPASVLSEDERAGWDRLGARYVALRPADAASEAPTDIIDIDGSLLEWMNRHGARVITVRPDKFVAAADSSGLAVPTI
jgi:3-(3-hydroxy-phenyl)propionate hydroxylase